LTTSYRRRLPHLHQAGQPVFVTARLANSLPPGRSFPAGLPSGQAFVPLYLGIPRIAGLMVETIHYQAESLRQYQLHSYVVMPNHIHLLITPWVPMAKLMHSLKRFSARQANGILQLTGSVFWQHESYDHLVRDDQEFQRIVRYIEGNPVKAGMASHPEQFRWSSAFAASGVEPLDLPAEPYRRPGCS
jgi:putative transposase